MGKSWRSRSRPSPAVRLCWRWEPWRFSAGADGEESKRRSLKQSPGFALDAQELAGGEHPQIIDALAEERAEIAAVKREQYIGAGERGDEDRLVLGHVEVQGPVEGEFIALDVDSSTQRGPGAGGSGRFILKTATKMTADYADCTD